jgi:hypothetical protein
MKTGGRAKGTPNKLTSEVRKIISDSLTPTLENLQNDLNSLSTKDRLDIVAKLLNFVLPKLKETDINTISDNQQPNEIIVNIVKSD